MSIVAYTGLQGSGKTYEVVSEVVVQAVRAGRRIVTNIQGLKADAIASYCLERWKERVEPQIVVVRNAQVEAEHFFYYEREGPAHETVKAQDTTCRAGDLVVIDECWRFWSSGSKWPATHQIFFREHRHYTDADGVSSDLVLITQSITDLDRKLRSVVERTFNTRKLKELGLRSGYTVFQFEKGSEAPRALLQKWVKRYDPRIFPLYDSYSAGQGAERAVDRRESFFGSSKVYTRIAFVVLVLAGGVWGVVSFFTPPKERSSEGVKPSVATDKGKAAQAAARPALSSQARAREESEAVSAEWRQVGYLIRGGELLVVVRTADGRYRYLRDPDHTMAGRELAVKVDGKTVTTWSAGAAAPRSLLGSAK